MSTQQQPAGHTAEQTGVEHTGVVAVVDEVRERFMREWDSLKTHARAAFAKLTEEDLESVKGRFDELRHRVVKAYGYAEERAHDEITRLLHSRPAMARSATIATHLDAKVGKKKNRGAKRHAKATKATAH